MKKLVLAAIALAAFHVPAFSQEVRPEIARDCAAKWGTDYEMQAYCRKKQMEAYASLHSAGPVNYVGIYRDTMIDAAKAAHRIFNKGGLAAVNRAVNRCYNGAKNRDNIVYCSTIDTYAMFKGKGRANSPKATAEREVKNVYMFFGDDARDFSSSITGTRAGIVISVMR